MAFLGCSGLVPRRWALLDACVSFGLVWLGLWSGGTGLG
jgi:hypothetical protein